MIGAAPTCAHFTLRSITPGGLCPLCDHVSVGRPIFVDVLSELTKNLDLRTSHEREARASNSAKLAGVHATNTNHAKEKSYEASTVTPSLAAAHLPAPHEATTTTTMYSGTPPTAMNSRVGETILSTVQRAAHDAHRDGDTRIVQLPAHLVGLTHEDIVAERCRRSLSYFVRIAWTVVAPGIPLHWNWHLEQMCRHVQGMLEEWIKKQIDPSYEMKAQNLAINCPPRSLKSTIVSVCAPAWMWLQWSSWKGLFLSANPKVARRDALACLALLRAPWYENLKGSLAAQHAEGTTERAKYEWTITADGIEDITNSAGGHRMAMGFLAVVVGLGGDALFIDDPNDTKKVMAEAERAKINDTWDLSLCNRVNSYTDSIRILIMQRCHELDLTGHWMCTMPADMTVYLAMPLEYDPEQAADSEAASPFGYRDPRTILNQCIHPARFTTRVIEAERVRLGPYGFAGQMNQKPVPLEGGAFKRAWWNFCTVASAEPHHHALVGTMLEGQWQRSVDGSRFIARVGNSPEGKVLRPQGCDMTKYAKPCPFFDRIVITVDATFGSLKEEASRVGLLAVGMHGADRYVLEDRTIQRTFPETCQAIRDLKKDFPSSTTTLIEKKANGEAVITTLNTEIGGCIAIEDNENWMVRANAMLPYVAGGNWYLLDGAAWLVAFVSEFSMFPNGAHDDRIDCCSQLSKYYAATGTLPDW